MRAALIPDLRWRELVAAISPAQDDWNAPAANLSVFDYARVLFHVDDPDRLNAFVKSLLPLAPTPIGMTEIEVQAARLAASE